MSRPTLPPKRWLLAAGAVVAVAALALVTLRDGSEQVTMAATDGPAPAPDAPPIQIVVSGTEFEPIQPQKVLPVGNPIKRKPPPPPPFSFRVASFNILGHFHTTKGGSKSRYASSARRMPWTVGMLRSTGISVAGLQEVQPEQVGMFKRQAPEWGMYPGPADDRRSTANSIVYRYDTWELVEGNRIAVPYFGGRPVAMPYILLEHRESGRRVWFFNTHNPADAHGPAQRWRNQATSIQIGLANRLMDTGDPVVFTGDMNDRAEYFCPMTTRSAMRAANGGSSGSPCQPPGRMDVDWIFGSPDISWSSFASRRDSLVARTSDHPLVWAEAYIEQAKR